MKNFGRMLNLIQKALVIFLLGLTVVCFQNCGQIEGAKSLGSASLSAPSAEDDASDSSANPPVTQLPPDTQDPVIQDPVVQDPVVKDPVVPTPPPANPPANSVAHGSDLTPAMVGPAAIGITSFTKIAGGGLYDNNGTSFGVNVPDTAVYDGVIVQGPHLLIQGKEMSLLDIYSSKKIVIRGSKIRGTSYWNINIRQTATGGIYIMHNDLGGLSETNFGSKAMSVGAANVHIYRNYVSYSIDGINLMVDNVTMIENYMHNFSGDATAHYDGITNYGGEDNITILRNKILLNKSDTGALNIGAGDGSISDWIVDSNYIAGGGYTCYCGGESNGNTTTNFKFTNNIFGYDFFAKVGHWGPVTWEAPKVRGNVYQGNKYSNGQALNF